MKGCGGGKGVVKKLPCKNILHDHLYLDPWVSASQPFPELGVSHEVPPDQVEAVHCSGRFL